MLLHCIPYNEPFHVVLESLNKVDKLYKVYKTYCLSRTNAPNWTNLDSPVQSLYSLDTYTT